MLQQTSAPRLFGSDDQTTLRGAKWFLHFGVQVRKNWQGLRIAKQAGGTKN